MSQDPRQYNKPQLPSSNSGTTAKNVGDPSLPPQPAQAPSQPQPYANRPELAAAQQQIQQQRATYGNQATAEATVQAVRNLPANAQNVRVSSVPMSGPLPPGQSERPSGVRVTYEEPREEFVPPKSVSERILDYGETVPTLDSARFITGRPGIGLGLPGQRRNPLSAPAGVVAAGESIVYSVPRGLASTASFIVDRAGFIVNPLERALGGDKAVGSTQKMFSVAAPNLINRVIPAPPRTVSGELIASASQGKATEGLGFVTRNPAYALGTLLPEMLATGQLVDSAPAIKEGIQNIARPKVETSVTDSYITQQKLNENILAGKVEGETAIWKPSTMQRIGMKLTGAQPKSLAPNISSFSTAQDVGYDLGMLEAENTAFEMGYSPRSSFQGLNKGITPPSAPVAPSKLPVYFGLGTDTFAQVKEGDSQTIWEKPEKGLPENQLAYDYRGPLGFKQPTAFEQIAALKQQGGGGMKNIFNESPKAQAPNGANLSYGESGYSVSLVKEQTSGINFRNPLPNAATVQATEEVQSFNYPSFSTARGMAQTAKPMLAIRQTRTQALLLNQVVIPTQANRQGARDLLDVGVVARQDSSLSFIPASILKEELVPSLMPMQDTIVSQVPQQKTTPGPEPFSFYRATSPSALNFDVPLGSKFLGGASDFPSPFTYRGLRSRKRVYPVLSGKEALKI